MAESNDAVLDSYRALISAARSRGENDRVEELLSRARNLSGVTERIDRQKVVESAQSRVSVDPLAGFRKPGAGGQSVGPIPNMLRPLGPRSHEESLRPDYTVENWEEQGAREPWRGVVGLGRGFQNVTEGSKQVGGHLAAGVGRMANPDLEPQLNEENFRRQQEILQRRESEDQPYGVLKRGHEGSMLASEIVGETAPFLNVPVGRLAGPFSKGISRLLNPVVRAAPEATAGAAEAGIAFAPSEEEREERGETGAIGAVLGKYGVDALSKFANIKRKIMKDDSLQEMHNLGIDFNVPVREGRMLEQIDAAGSVAESRGGVRTMGELGEEVSLDLANEFAAKEARMDRQYDELFAELDKGAPGRQRGAGGKFMPRGTVDATDIKKQAQNYLDSEITHGTMSDPAVIKEYKRWLDFPDNVKMSNLHQYRKSLRERAPASNTYAQGKYAELDAFVSEDLARRADLLQPGAGNMLRQMDHWFYEELPRLREIPAIRELLKHNPTPGRVLNWVMTTNSPARREVAGMMSGVGRKAITESFWNQAYRSGTQGRSFNPNQYAKFVDKNLDNVAQFMPVEEMTAFKNLGKLMKHISGEGAAPDTSLLKLIRGYPFMYRAMADRVRQSNFIYMMKNVSPSARPGTPAMDRFYRGLIRGIQIQEPGDVSGPWSEGVGNLYEASGAPSIDEAKKAAIGLLEE